ncbi:MAG: hypothetical protein VW602_05825 [Paracoccaceae bacterium]
MNKVQVCLCRLVAGLLTIAIFGCSEELYRAELRSCENHFLKQIPPRLKQHPITNYRMEHRATGKSICKTGGAVTIFEDKTELVSIPLIDVEIIDENKLLRDAKIHMCVRKSCAEKYGNDACKTP